MLDTNLLINDIDLSQFEVCYICFTVLEELDKHKESSDSEKAFKARRGIRNIRDCENVKYLKDYSLDLPLWLDLSRNDNKILAYFKKNFEEEEVVFLTGDLNLYQKALALQFKTAFWDGNIGCKDEKYKGYKEIIMTDCELAEWYETETKINKWGLLNNEYLIIKNKDNGVSELKVWTEQGFRNVSIKKIDSTSLGKIKLLDEHQICAVDSLFNNSVTMIKGRHGSGKSLLTLTYTMSMIEKNKIDKLILLVNPCCTKNSAKQGFYPGTRLEKMLDSFAGHMLKSKFGDILEVEKLVKINKLDILPFSDIRGFDTTGTKSLIWITEAQNLDIELMKLAIQRVGNDCQLCIDGDYETQVDLSVFEGSKNGMRRVSEIFKGKDFYGEVELQNIYRSKWAKIAELL
jgi:predicted ribonuclease YlaK